MAIIKIENEKQWHELRAKHIGGSEVAALFGASSYSTPYEMYHEKRGSIVNDFDTPLMQLGRMLEPIIAHYVADIHSWRVVKCEDYLEHPEHKHLGCTLDYYVVESEQGAGILEIKNVQQFSPGWTDTRAPEYVEWQVQHQLLVANAARKEAGLPEFKWAAIGSMHSGNPEDIRIMLRQPDAKAHKAIIERTTKFWNDVEQGNEPPVQGSQDYDVVTDIFKAAEVKEQEAIDLRGDDEIDTMLDTYYKKKEEANLAEKEAKKLKTEIMQRLLIDGKAHMAARTDTYTVNIKESSYMRKPQPAKEVTTLRFNVKLAEV